MLFKYSALKSVFRSIFHVFFSRNFIFGSYICICFLFLVEIWICHQIMILFWHSKIWFSHTHLLKRLLFYHYDCLMPLPKTNWPYMLRCISALCFAILNRVLLIAYVNFLSFILFLFILTFIMFFIPVIFEFGLSLVPWSTTLKWFFSGEGDVLSHYCTYLLISVVLSTFGKSWTTTVIMFRYCKNFIYIFYFFFNILLILKSYCLIRCIC